MTRMPEYSWENTRRVSYEGGAVFIPVCPNCGRYVKADDTVRFNDYGPSEDCNATCSKCGRVNMIFEGYY